MLRAGAGLRRQLSMDAMGRKSAKALFFLALGTVAGCTSKTGSEENVVKEAFEAIKEGDLQRYEKITITAADYLLKKQGVSVFKARQTYAGGVLRREERETQRKEFDMAKAGGPGRIDFTGSELVGPGKRVEQGVLPYLEGVRIPYATYSVIIRTAEGKKIDTRNFYPLFMVAAWGDEYRMLGLVFPEKEAGTMQPPRR